MTHTSEQPAARSAASVASGRRYQRRWLYAYGTSASMNLIFVLLALTGDNVPPASYFAVLTGTVTSFAGAVMASHLVRIRVSDVDFDEATATIRVIAVGWLLSCIAMAFTVMAATDFGARATVGPEATPAILNFADGITAQLFGVAALFVVAGDSYTRYRRLLDDRAAGLSRRTEDSTNPGL